MTKLLTDKCTEAIKLNVKTENLRTESGVGQLGPSLLCLFFLDSAERHRRILRLSPLLLLSIITEHPNWVEKSKETRWTSFQVVYAFPNDVLRDIVLVLNKVRKIWDHWDGPLRMGPFRQVSFRLGPRPHSWELWEHLMCSV